MRYSPTEHFLYGDPDWYEVYRHAEWTEDMDVEHVNCPAAPRKHMRAGERIDDLRVILSSLRIADFTWTWYSEPLVTDYVRGLFADAGFTGLEFLDVTVERVKDLRGRRDIKVPRMWELVVTGKGGDAHQDSGIRLFYECSDCGMQVYSSFRRGIIVDESQWDGSDFFTVNGYPKFILITERVKNLVVENELTNCAVLRSRDLEWGDFPRPEDHPEYFLPDSSGP